MVKNMKNVNTLCLPMYNVLIFSPKKSTLPLPHPRKPREKNRNAFYALSAYAPTDIDHYQLMKAC